MSQSLRLGRIAVTVKHSRLKYTTMRVHGLYDFFFFLWMNGLLVSFVIIFRKKKSIYSFKKVEFKSVFKIFKNHSLKKFFVLEKIDKRARGITRYKNKYIIIVNCSKCNALDNRFSFLHSFHQ